MPEKLEQSFGLSVGLDHQTNLEFLPSLEVNFAALRKVLKLSKNQVTELQEALSTLRHLIKVDPEFEDLFQKTPLLALPKIYEQLRVDPDAFWKRLRFFDVDPFVVDPNREENHKISIELLEKLSAWVNQNAGNRVIFSNNPEASVNQVAGTAPVFAILGVQRAIRSARRLP